MQNIVFLMDQNNIAIDTIYQWSKLQKSDITIYLKGDFYYENIRYEKDDAITKLYELFGPYIENSLSVKNIDMILNCIRGHYSFILNSQNYTLAVVDRIRSYPVYYLVKEPLLISNSASSIQKKYSLYDLDYVSMLQFEMSGFVLGRETLYKDIYQLLAGEYLFCEKNKKKLIRHRYYEYGLGPFELNNKSDDLLLDDLHNLHLKIFSEMIESLDGRPVFLPLSGGLDSRLILSMLLKLKYKNIITFSYGINNYWEIKRAKQIANFLNVEWHYIPYDPHQTREYFNTEDRDKYYDYAWGMSTVPVLNDYYAILMMKEQNLITKDAVFINGQSGDYLTGGHLPIIAHDEYNIETLLSKIIDKHHSLWLQLKTEKNLKLISDKILSTLKLSIGNRISDDDFAKYYEYCEWQERQCKFVVNGQRVYEWFDYDWRLPLWNDELMFFWEKIPWKKKAEQKLFKRYLEVFNPSSVFVNDWYSPDYKHVPLLLRIITSVSRKILHNYDFQTKFVNYYSTYAAYYPQNNFWDYLKESSGHRNTVSFHARLILKNIKKI